MTSPHAHTLQVPVCFSLCKSLPPWVDCAAQPSWCSRHTEKEKERLLQWHLLFLGLLLLHPRQRLVAQGAAAASRTSCHRRHTPARRTHPPTTWWTALGGSVKAAPSPWGRASTGTRLLMCHSTLTETVHNTSFDPSCHGAFADHGLSYKLNKYSNIHPKWPLRLHSAGFIFKRSTLNLIWW